MTRFYSAIFIMAVVIATPAAAIVTRDDVPTAAYAARASRLPTYCQLHLPDGGGALIAPDWVLTAAHLVPSIKSGARIACGDETLTVAQAIAHPAYDDAVGRHDIALIRLAAPSRQRPLKLWPAPVAAGATIELIGHYQGGTGLTGGVGRNPAGLRAATNRVAVADHHWLRMVMDRPSSADVTPFEGVSGAGDSGAPAFIIRRGTPYVVAVGSRSADSNDNGVEQDYGDTDLYVPVASYAGWIGRVVDGRETAPWRLLDSQADRSWSTIALAALGAIAFAALTTVAARTRRPRSA